MEKTDDAQSMETNKYNLLCDDLEAMNKLINSHVKVEVIKNCSFTGFVHSLDPITRSIILSVPQEDVYQTLLIPGHAILDITEVPMPDNICPPKRKELQLHNAESIAKKKSKLVSWLKLNLVPVSELDEKIIIGNVSILPPYDIVNLCTDNPIVSMQIKKIMEQMPEEYEPK